MDNYEKCLIGTLIQDPKSIYEAYHIQPEDFQIQQHQLIWSTLQDLVDKKALSERSLIEALRSQNQLDTIGTTDAKGESYISELVNLADSTAIKEYAKQVVDASTKRKLQMYGAMLTAAARNGKEAEEIIEDHVKLILQLRREGVKNVHPIGELLPQFDERMMDIRNHKISPFWRPNVHAIADVLGHMTDVDFQIVVGTPGTGKSSYLRYEGVQTAKLNQPVITITLENSEEECLSWAIAMVAKVNHYHVIDTTKASNKEMERIKNAMDEVSKFPWFVAEMASASYTDLAATVRRALLTQKASLIQIDGMYLLQGRTDSQYETISTNAQNLRSLAQELHIPIQATTQYSRQVKHKKEPTLADLLYAGENPARQVLGLIKQEMDNRTAAAFPENKDHNGHIIHRGDGEYDTVVVRAKILKNTNGPIGKSEEIAWIKPYNLYNTLGEDWKPSLPSAPKDIPEDVATRVATYPEQRRFTPDPKPQKKEKKSRY